MKTFQYFFLTVIFCTAFILSCGYFKSETSVDNETSLDSTNAEIVLDSLKKDSLEQALRDSISRVYEEAYHINGELIPEGEIPKN